MSTSYGIYCRTCKVTSADYEAHNTENIQITYECSDEIFAINKKVNAFEGWLNCPADDLVGHGMSRFLIEHYKHDLCIKSEYGDVEEFKNKKEVNPDIEHIGDLRERLKNIELDIQNKLEDK